MENRSGGQAGVVRGGRFRTSRRIWFLPFTVRALTANGKTVVDASESRAKIVFVALAIRAPASARTRRTLAGVGKAESMEFHGSLKRSLQPSHLSITRRGSAAAPGLEVELESVEGRMGRCHCCAGLNKSVGSLSGICSASDVDPGVAANWPIFSRSRWVNSCRLNQRTGYRRQPVVVGDNFVPHLGRAVFREANDGTLQYPVVPTC